MNISTSAILNESILIEDPNDLDWLFIIFNTDLERCSFSLEYDQLIINYYDDDDNYIEIKRTLTGDDLKKSLKRQKVRQRLIDDNNKH